MTRNDAGSRRGPRRSTDRIVEEATAILADYIRDGRTRTDLLKDVAALIVELRSRFHLESGRTDWGGRSPEYRAAMAQVYTGAHVPPQYLDTVQAALRYHVGNLLRQKATAEDLEAVGMSTVAPRERLQSHRDAVNAIAASVSNGEGLTRGDIARIVTHAEALLEYVDTSDLDTLDPARLVAARLSLEAILDRAQALLAEVVAAEERGR